jgi:hypothetical protein
MISPTAKHFLAVALAVWLLGPATPPPALAAKPKSAAEKEKEVEAKALPCEKVDFIRDGRDKTVEGRIVIEAGDGGVLMESADGMLWTIERSELQHRTKLETPFKPLTQAEMSEKLISELPGGFRSYTTAHYVVIHNTSRTYAQWASSLLERLYKAFTNYWEGQGIEIHEPEFPLPVFLFSSRQEYEQASRDDLPNGTGNIIGFYSLRSNRVNMFDLTGLEAVRAANSHGSIREINTLLSQPAAVPLVATVVHEATHQIAFNCGLQQRYADIPLWLCEGMAVYFEAPDLASTRGWRGIGRVNYPRLETFQRNISNWNEDTLEVMLRDSQRFRNPRTAVDAYADAWALNFYLIKYEPKAYTEYLKALAAKPPLVEDTREERLEEFRKHFGDLRKLEQDFLKQMGRMK